jgi:predicted amidohydrolase YtcJ
MEIIKVPMFHDNHNHVALNIALNNSLDARDKTYKEVIDTISKMSEFEINIVSGWMFYDFDRNDLEGLPPVLICDNFLHAFFLNKKAKEKIKPKYPKVAENIENRYWVEKFLPLILSIISDLKGITDKSILEYFEFLESKGVYSVEDMLCPNGNFIDQIQNTKYKDRCKFWMAPEFYRQCSQEHKNKISGIKLFLDGALTPETASISGYNSGSSGMLINTDSELLELLIYIESENKNTAIHSVGDGAIEQLLRILENNNINISLIRLEHAMFITKEQAFRAKTLGIVLSMQPNFSYDSIVFKKTIKEETLSKNNPFRMLIDEVGFKPGKDLIFSSDGMPSGMEFAVKCALFPPYKNQQLTLEELIAGYSIKDAKELTLKIENREVSIIN